MNKGGSSTDAEAADHTDASGGNHQHATQGDTKQHRVLRTGIGLLAFAFVLHVFILPLFSNFGTTWHTLTKIKPSFALTAIAIEGASWWLVSESTRLLIRRDDRPRGLLFFAITLASNGLSRLIPAGAAGAAGVAYALLRKARVPNAKIAYAFAGSALMTAVTLNGLLVTGVIIGLFRSSRFHSYVVPAVLALAAIIAIVGFVAALLWRTDGTARFIGHIVGWLPNVDGRSVERWVTNAASRLHILLQDPMGFLRLTLITGGRWVVESIALWTVFAGLGTHLDIFVVFVALALANVVSFIPISPGGLGIFEATMIGVFVAFGTDHSTATAGVMAFRGISFWLMIPVGVIANIIANWAINNHRGFAPSAS